MGRARTLGVAAALLAALAGCIARTPFVPPQPASTREFPTVLAQARLDAAGGRYADADHELAQFAARYPGTPEAEETEYWRALLQLDPANHDGSIAAGVAELDRYVAGSTKPEHYDEALTLRRLAFELQTATRVAAASAAMQTAQAARVPDEKARDAEIQRLRDSLAKANDELDRIKRRLTSPTRP